MSPSLDTNVLLRLVLGDVPEQQNIARDLLGKYTTFNVADVAITEMVFVLERVLGFSRSDIVALMTSLIENQYLHLNRNLFVKVLPIYSKYKSLSFNDICLAVYAELNEATPLYTFDKALAKKLPRLVKEV